MHNRKLDIDENAQPQLNLTDIIQYDYRFRKIETDKKATQDHNRQFK